MGWGIKNGKVKSLPKKKSRAIFYQFVNTINRGNQAPTEPHRKVGEYRENAD